VYLALLKLFRLALEAVDWVRLHALRYFASPLFQSGSGNIGERAAKLPLSDWRYPITIVFALIEAVALSVWQIFRWLFFFNTRSIFEFFLSGVKIVIVLSVLSVVGLYGYLSGSPDPSMFKHYTTLHQKNTATALLGREGNIVGAVANPLLNTNGDVTGSLYAEMVPPVYWDILDHVTQRQLDFNYQDTSILDVILWRKRHYKGVSLAGIFNTINPLAKSSSNSLMTQLSLNLHNGEKSTNFSCFDFLNELCQTLSSARLAKHMFPYFANNKGAEFKRWIAIHGSLRGFQGDVAGLRATADVVFNKKPEQLNNAEQALMAVAQLNNEPLLESRNLAAIKNEAISISRELYAQTQPILVTNIEQGLLDLNLTKTGQSNLSSRSTVALGNFTDLVTRRLTAEYAVAGNQRIITDAQISLPVGDNERFKQGVTASLNNLQKGCFDCGLNYQLGGEVAEGGANMEIVVADQEGQIVRYLKQGDVSERAIGALSSIPAAVMLTMQGNLPNARFCNQTYQNLPSSVSGFPRGLVNCETLDQQGHSLSFQQAIQVRASLPLFYALRKQASAEQLQTLYRHFGLTDLRTKAGNTSHAQQLAYEMSYGVVQSTPLHLLDIIHQLGDVLYGRAQSKAVLSISQFLVTDLEAGKRYLEFNRANSDIAVGGNYLRTQNAKASLRQLLSYDVNNEDGVLKSLRNIKNGKFLLTKTGQSYTKLQTLRDHWLVSSVLIRGRRYSVSAFVGAPVTDQEGLAKKLTAAQIFRPIMAEIIDSLD